MYVAFIPNRTSRPAILIRESYREDGKVKNRTVANISHWPMEQVEALRVVLKGEMLGVVQDPVVERGLAHGHVAAVLGSARKIGLERALSSKRTRLRDLAMALICGRILSPLSKLSFSQTLLPSIATHTLGQELDVVGATEDELYSAMDWLLERQEKIEQKLAKTHLHEGCTVLYDLSSSYFEGTTCPLAKYGYSRDHRSDRLQVNYGLLCNEDGVPVAIEVVEGNTSDPKTIPAQITKLKERFGLKRVVVVGDRGMVTTTQINKDIKTEDFGWIGALKHASIAKLAQAKVITPSLFDERDMAEISHESFPGERLVACRNPFLKEKEEKTREALLALTEKELAKVADACNRKKDPLSGKDEIGIAAGRVVNRYGMAKYLQLHVGEHSLRYARRREALEQAAATDGIYVIRTSESKEAFTDEQAVATYKSLAKVERAFRCLKGVDLQVRPIYHRLETRVRAHLFLCMLAYYLEHHLRKCWQSLLFHDEEGGMRESPVSPLKPSDSAKRKKRSPRSNPELPILSFQGLLEALSSLGRSVVRLGTASFTRCTQPTPLQIKAFKLLELPVP